jgi:hypothetical protein
VQVQHVAVTADDGEDRISLRKYSHRLCSSCESNVVVVDDAVVTAVVVVTNADRATHDLVATAVVDNDFLY